MSTTAAPGFRRGAEAAKEASKGGGGFPKTHYFGLGDNEVAFLRFITDAPDWLVVNQHGNIPTKGKPDGYDGNWPDHMGAVCRRDEAFAGIHDDCYICDHMVDGKKIKKPSGRSWAFAVEREEVVEGGVRKGFKDKTREVVRKKRDAEGKETDETETTIEKAIVVVNLGYKNFFSILQGFASRYGTCLDRDYWIKRSGTDTSTTYQIVPEDPVETQYGRFGPAWEKDGVTFFQRYGFADADAAYQALADAVADKASDDFYNRFFDRRVVVSDKGEVSEASGGTEVPAQPDSEVPSERLAALADRIKGHSGDTAKEEPKAEEAAAPAEEPKEPATAGASTGGMQDFD